jgi:hypothetical protein
LQDVTSGVCFQSNELTENGDFGQKMTAEEHQAFTQCGFNSMEGFQLAENLECNVRPGLPCNEACTLALFAVS